MSGSVSPVDTSANGTSANGTHVDVADASSTANGTPTTPTANGTRSTTPLDRSAIIQRNRAIIDTYMNCEEDDNDPYMHCNIDETVNDNNNGNTKARTSETASLAGDEASSTKSTSEANDQQDPVAVANSNTPDRSTTSPTDVSTDKPAGPTSTIVNDSATSTGADKPTGTPSDTVNIGKSTTSDNVDATGNTSTPSVDTSADASKSKPSADTKPTPHAGDPASPKISIEVSSSKAASMSDSNVTATIEQAKQSFIDSLAADVAKLEESNSVRIDNIERYLPTSDNHGSYITFMLGKFFVPKAVTQTLSMNDFINSATTFKYDAYDSPNMSITHPLSESVIYLKRLSELFGFEFLSSVSAKWKFDELDSKLTEFLAKHAELPSTVLEYELIKNFMGKIAIALSTTTERAFRESRTPLVNATYRSVIAYDIAVMNQLKGESKWFKSWSKFMDAFYGTGADNFVYTHESYAKLNEHLEIAYANDFLTEIMVANMLKCYFPSISLNYFYVIKCVYIIARLLTVYSNKLDTDDSFKSRTLEDIMNDINVICSVGVIIYENKNFIFKQTSHSLPRYTDDVNEKTNMYILNHLFTGGQYYLLKMFEVCGPVLANMFHHRLNQTRDANSVADGKADAPKSTD